MSQENEIASFIDQIRRLADCHRCRGEIVKASRLLERGKPFMLQYDGKHVEVIQLNK
jgi:hypothetical protein